MLMSVSGTKLTLGSTLADANYSIEVHKAGAPPTADNSEAAGATPTAGSVKINGRNLGSALAGSIAATRLSSNTTSGFSITLMTGTEANATVAHGLSSSPEWVVHKERVDGGNHWATWHIGIANTTFIPLDTAVVLQTSATKWNSTSPTATTYSLGTDTGNNEDDATYVTYGWHGVEGYSQFGTYAGVSDANGPMISTNFSPSSVLIRGISAATSWQWTTESIDPVHGNPTTGFLVPDTDAAIDTSAIPWDFVSNGAKIRRTGGALNLDDRSYIYCMWGGRPMTDDGINQGRADRNRGFLSSVAQDGIISFDGDFAIHIFNASGKVVFYKIPVGGVEYLVNAGGGGGAEQHGGGGGAGGYLTATGMSVLAQEYSITVGAGGAGSAGGSNARGTNGANSVFNGITSTGGGGGGTYISAGGTNAAGADGGSGGGGSRY